MPVADAAAARCSRMLLRSCVRIVAHKRARNMHIGHCNSILSQHVRYAVADVGCTAVFAARGAACQPIPSTARGTAGQPIPGTARGAACQPIPGTVASSWLERDKRGWRHAVCWSYPWSYPDSWTQNRHGRGRTGAVCVRPREARRPQHGRSATTASQVQNITSLVID